MNGIAGFALGLMASLLPLSGALADENAAMDWQGRWTRMLLADAGGVLRPLPEPDRLTFEIGPDLRVSASVGCNSIGTVLEPGDDGAIGFGPAMATRMGCMGAVGEAENRFVAALDSVERYEMRDADVAFLDAAGNVLFVIGR